LEKEPLAAAGRCAKHQTLSLSLDETITIKKQIALTKPLKAGERAYVKIRTETDEAALAGIDPMMENTTDLGEDDIDTKEEFVLCAFIGNAVESCSVDLVLRDYCEFAVETSGGSEVEAHVTGYYVPEYDEDEEAAMRMYGGEGEDGEEMYDDEDDEDEEDDEDFMGFGDDEDDDFTSSSDDDDEDEEDDDSEEDDVSEEEEAGGGKKVTQKGGVVIKELSDDEDDDEDEDEDESESEEEEEEEEEAPKKRQQSKQQAAPAPASKKQKTDDVGKQNAAPNKDNVNTQKPTKEHRNGMEIVNTHQTTKPNSKKATPGSRCQMKYVGKLPSGKIFDQTKGNAGFTFRLGVGEVIKGWDVGVNGMREGDKRTLYVPASMGYGKKGVPGTIPKNSPLVFDVELMRVLK
jgi:FK506-binding nuclear protein